MHFTMFAISQTPRLTPIPVRNVLTDLLRHSYKPSNRGSNYLLSVGKSQLQSSQQISNTFGIFGAQSLHKSVKLNISPYACYITHNFYKKLASFSTIFFKNGSSKRKVIIYTVIYIAQ